MLYHMLGLFTGQPISITLYRTPRQYAWRRSHLFDCNSTLEALQRLNTPRAFCHRANHVAFWAEFTGECMACCLMLDDTTTPQPEASIARVDRSFLLSSPGVLNGDYVRLHYLGYEEAEYFFKSAKDARYMIGLIESIKTENSFTKDVFISEYRAGNKKTQMAINAMLKTFDGLFETLTVNISPIFWSKDGELLKRRFPNMWKWMMDCDHDDKNTSMRDQRNSSAHRGGVRAVYPKHPHDNVRRRKFYPGPFWDNLDAWLPPLILELDDLIDILGQDLPNMPYLDTEELPDGPSLITVAVENEKASDELARSSYDPYLWYLRTKYSFGYRVHRWMEWLGEKWTVFSGSWLNIINGWKLEETAYAEGMKKKIEAARPRDPSKQPGGNDGSWGDQPSGADVPIGDWADRMEEQPFEQPSGDQSPPNNGAFDVLALQGIMWVQFRPVEQETPEEGRELLRRSRSNSAPPVLSISDVQQ